MAADLDRLARRVRASVEAGGRSSQEEQEARRRRREAGEAARKALLEELVRFAESTGAVVAAWEGEVLVWSANGRTVRFDPAGSADRLKVTWRESWTHEGRLYREEELGDRWVLAWGAPPREERVILVEAGLVRLLVTGLGLPEPAEDDDEAPAPIDEADEATAEPTSVGGRRL
jgi:hypothetical protein